MAVTVANITSGEGGTGFTTKDTASVNIVAGRLYILSVENKRAAGSPNVPTATGLSQTWAQIATKASSSGQASNVTLFRCVPSSNQSGAITMDFGGQAQDRAVWVLDEFSNISDTGGSNGSVAVVQSGNTAGNGTSASITLSALGSPNNASYGAIGNIGPVAVTPGSGYTETAEPGSAETGLETEFKAAGSTTVDWSFSSTDYEGLAIEIKAGAVSTSGFFEIL